MRTPGQAIWRMSAAFLILLGTNQICYGWASFKFWGRNTHERIFDDAKLNVTDADYPDIKTYRSQLRSGAEDEDSHKDATGKYEEAYWYGNQNDWEIRATTQEYVAFNFALAYQHLGYVLHLTQDTFVPAHSKYVYHGPLGFTPTYRKSPLEPDVYLEGGATLDDLESYAGSNPDTTPASPFDYDRQFLDPDTGCPSKFWLSPAEDSDADNTRTTAPGAYGRNSSGTCDIPGSLNGRDWFGDADPVTQEAISHRQMYASRVATEDKLKNLSKTLPPLIRIPLKTSSQVIDVNTGTTFTFKVLENRTSTVKVSLLVDGVAIKDVAGKVWNQSEEPGENYPNGAELPYEKSFTVLWKGEMSNDSQLTDGAHTLRLAVRDTDVSIQYPEGNPAPDADNDGDNVPDTQVSAPLADPYFSDERKKLIFSDFAAKAHPKPGLYDIHHRKTHALSVTTGARLARVPA